MRDCWVLVGWRLQDICSLQSFCARANNPFLAPPHLHCPPWCNRIMNYTTIGQYTIPPPISRLYAIHHTIMEITILCKGQLVGFGGPTHTARSGRRAGHTRPLARELNSVPGRASYDSTA